MSYTCFEIEISDKVAHIKLNRPEKRNSMNLQFWDELPEIIADIDSEVKARVIVISSTGPHFSAGLDVQAFFKVINDQGADERAHRISRGADFYQIVKKMHKPTTVERNHTIDCWPARPGASKGM